MFQEGIVRKINADNTASVEIERSSACGESCVSCGMCPGRTAVVEARNDAGAAVGDAVMLDMSDKKVLGAAFLVYIVPVVMLLAGDIVGFALFQREAAGIAMGFAFMAVTFAAIIVTDKRRKRQYTPHIVRIRKNIDVGI